MTSQKLAGFLKLNWRPLAVIAIAVAVLAFAAGMISSNRRAPDEPTPAVGANSDVVPTPAVGANPALAPTPTFPPALYYTPTNEEWEMMRQARIEREKKRGVYDPGAEQRSGRVIRNTPAPSSTAEARFMEAPLGRALYFVSSDRVIFLPEGVEEWRSIGTIACYHQDCPAPPITVLKKGEGEDTTVSLDAYGYVVPFLDTDDPDAFPFLKEYDE